MGTVTIPERTVKVEDILKKNLLVLTGVGDNGEWAMAVVNRGSRYDDEVIEALKSIGCRVIATGSKKK